MRWRRWATSASDRAALGLAARESPRWASTDDDVVLARLHSLGLGGERIEDLDTELLSDGRGPQRGEQMRLVLARALLANAELIVLDDVAGVLDADARDQVAEPSTTYLARCRRGHGRHAAASPRPRGASSFERERRRRAAARWLKRARPPRSQLARALVAAIRHGHERGPLRGRIGAARRGRHAAGTARGCRRLDRDRVACLSRSPLRFNERLRRTASATRR